MTNYSEQCEVLSLLEGILLLVYVAKTALVVRSVVAGCIALCTLSLGRWSSPRLHGFVQSLIPIADAEISWDFARLP